MLIEVYGTEGPDFSRAYDNVKKAAEEMGLTPAFRKVNDISLIEKSGLTSTPAIVVDGNVKVTGKAPGIDEAKKFLGG